jgi:hypothetical protein
VGYRSNSIILGVEFIREAGWSDKILGLGFFNYDNYIINKYISYLGFEHSGFRKGMPGNVHAALLISIGLVGYILFIQFFWYATKCKDFFYHLQLFLVIMLTYLKFGNLTDPLFPALVVITRALIYTVDSKVKCNAYQSSKLGRFTTPHPSAINNSSPKSA